MPEDSFWVGFNLGLANHELGNSPTSGKTAPS